MLSDTVKVYLQTPQRPDKEQIAGGYLKKFYQDVVMEDVAISTDPEPLPEHYKELLSVMRSAGAVAVEVRLLRRVVASRLRDILLEKDAKKLVVQIFQIAREQQRVTLNKALLRGTLRALDVEGELLDRCVVYLKMLPALQIAGLWRYRTTQYALLSKPYGEKLADQLFVETSQEGTAALIVQSGLRELGDQGLRQLVHRKLTVRLATVLVDNNVNLNNSLHAFKLWETQATGEAGFRFPYERNSTAEKLLLPWESTNPNERLKNELLKFFLHHYGDPRTELAWKNVSERPRAIVRRWLAEASFELFIAIIKQSAPSEQWKARETFWRYYLNNNYVLDLRVAFGKQAAGIAREMNRKSGLDEQLAFASLRGAKSDQSVMVMKLKRCTIVEWSHEGKFRLWRESNENAPSLYEREYHESDVRSKTADEAVAHHGRFWLDNIGTAIYKYSGIKPKS